MQAEFQPATWKACWQAVVESRPATEIAAELGMTENAVFIAKCRVLGRLREELAGLSTNEPGVGTIQDGRVTVRVCEKMGTGSGRPAQNSDNIDCQPVPVPIFSQTLRTRNITMPFPFPGMDPMWK